MSANSMLDYFSRHSSMVGMPFPSPASLLVHLFLFMLLSKRLVLLFESTGWKLFARLQ